MKETMQNDGEVKGVTVLEVVVNDGVMEVYLQLVSAQLYLQQVGPEG